MKLPQVLRQIEDGGVPRANGEPRRRDRDVQRPARRREARSRHAPDEDVDVATAVGSEPDLSGPVEELVEGPSPTADDPHP